MSVIGQNSRKRSKKKCDSCRFLEGTLDRNDEEAHEDDWEGLDQGPDIC